MADETKCVNTVRSLSADIVEKAKSGHPGAPMGCAPMAHTLWGGVMRYSPKDPDWANRDRFVLSNGHACALQYAMLHLTGYAVSMDDLKLFRQIDSITPGHPENFCTAGIEVSTGPLGQGLSNAVGMAMAESHLAATFNKPDLAIVDHFTYVICGDGCLQEGITSETSSLAGHLGLGKLICLYDDNKIQIDGSTELAFTEDVKARYEAYNWHVIELADGTDLEALGAAVKLAQAETTKPSMIKIRTRIGEGCPSKVGSHKVHGAPLGAAGITEMKAHLGLPEEAFSVADDVAAFYSDCGAAGDAAAADWAALFAQYKAAHPAEAERFGRQCAGELPAGWQDAISSYAPESKALATRQWSELVLNELAPTVPELIGGSADLTPSNLTALKCSGDYQAATPGGRYIRFGVREHGMAAICNGIAAHGGLVPYCATFLNFIGYALGAVRVTALSRFRVIYVMTHDSIGLGEDGPTHQPVEMLSTLRTMPNMFTFRPGDGNEVAGSYVCALGLKNAPSVIACSRTGMPVQAGTSVANVAKGAYSLTPVAGAALIIAATGSELDLAVQAAAALGVVGTKAVVVSMPCTELFEQQPFDYKMTVFPAGVPVLSVEASSCKGWECYSHLAVGLPDCYGASGPVKAVLPKFGFTVANIVAQAGNLLKFYADKPCPSKIDVCQSTFVVTHAH